MANQTDCDVLIVGGSLGGLSAAAFLGHHGIRAYVVEKHHGTSIHPRAGHFHLGTLEAYRRIGLEQSILEASREQFGPDGGINLVETLAGRELAKFVPDINAGVDPYSPCRRLFMTQQSLEPLLHQRAVELGATLHYRTELVAFEQDAAGVTARVRDLDSGAEREIRARYMIAGDGNRSPVRAALGIGTHGPGWLSDSLTVYFRANCQPWLEGRQLGVIYVKNADLRGFFRFEAGGTRGFLAVNTLGDLSLLGAKTVANDTSPEHCAALVRSAVGVPDLALEIDDVATWKAEAICADAFRRGRVFLMGDAAHVVPPTGGFGGNTGVGDAANLAWKLAQVLKGEAQEALLDSYEEERLPVAEVVVEQAYARYIRRVVPEEINASTPEMRDDLTTEIGQLYRSGAVVRVGGAHDPAYGHPDAIRGLPGARLPHAWLDDGRSTLDLVGTSPVRVLGPDGGGDGIRLSRAVAAECGIADTGGVLVRPDGFIAEAWPA